MRRAMRGIIAALALLCWMAPGEVWAATVYAKLVNGGVRYQSGAAACSDVDAADTSGTLQAALTAAGAIGTLYVCEGEYAGTQVDTGDGLDSTATGQSVVGLGTVSIDMTGLDDQALAVTHAGFTASKLTLANAPSAKYGIYTSVAGTFNDIRVVDCSRGIYLFSNAGGTFNRCVVQGTTDTTYCMALAGTANAATFNYCVFYDSAGAIRSLDNVTIVFNNCAFVKFADNAFRDSTGKTPSHTFNNCIFSACCFNGPNNIVVNAYSSGTWAFNNCVLGDAIIPRNKFLYNAGGATVTYTSCPDTYTPGFASYGRPARVFIGIDDTTNLNDWYLVADLAETYGFRVCTAIYRSGSSGVNWSKLAGYVARGHEVQCHGFSDCCEGTANAFTAFYSGTHTLTISAATKPDANDSSTWSRTLQLDSNPAITLSDGGSYPTLNQVYTYLTGLGVTVGQADGQVPWGGANYAPKSISLAAGTYSIGSSAQTVLFERSDLLQVEHVESKAWLEAQMRAYIPGWTARSFVWPVGSHDATSEAYVMDTAGFEQVRGVMDIGGTSYFLSALDMGRVGSLDASDALGTTEASIKKELNGYVDALEAFGGVGGIHDHSLATWSLANWGYVFSTLKSRGVVVGTFSEVMDWARANDDHVTGHVSYRCASGTESCFEDAANFSLTDSSQGVNAGKLVTGLHDQASAVADITGVAVRTLPDIGPHEYGVQKLYFNSSASGAVQNGTKAHPYDSFGDYAFTGYNLREGASLILAGALGSLDLSGLTDTGAIAVKSSGKGSLTGFVSNGGSVCTMGGGGASGVIGPVMGVVVQ